MWKWSERGYLGIHYLRKRHSWCKASLHAWWTAIPQPTYGLSQTLAFSRRVGQKRLGRERRKDNAPNLVCVLSCVWLFEARQFLCPWNFPGKNTWVGCHLHFLLQGIFLTQGSTPCLLCLLQWQADSLQLAPPDLGHVCSWGSPWGIWARLFPQHWPSIEAYPNNSINRSDPENTFFWERTKPVKWMQPQYQDPFITNHELKWAKLCAVLPCYKQTWMSTLGLPSHPAWSLGFTSLDPYFFFCNGNVILSSSFRALSRRWD